MYDEHYGLSGRPFQLTPDPKFWFESATHKKAMAYLGYGLSQGEGFIVVTGDIGAGKTTLVGHLMATIDRERLHAIKIVSTQIEADDLLRMVATGLDIDPTAMVKAQLLSAIERGLHAVARSGRRTLLIVDEAQALHTSALEELRMLSNFQAGGHALLQIFLLGQPEFRERLQGSERLEQLRQRVIATHHLDPMGPGEVAAYIHHRLNIVGWQGRPGFTDDAFAALYAGSDGVPRRLNQLAGRVMLFGAIEQLDLIDGATVATVIADMNGDAAIKASEPAVLAEMISTPVAETEVLHVPEVPESPAPLPIVGLAASESTFVTEVAAVEMPVAVPTIAESDFARLADQVANLDEMVALQGHRISAVAEDGRDDRATHAATDARIAALEARIEEQEAALRRILTLLIDWIESDSHRPDLAAYRGLAG
ncbi:MAG: AAA family ATPase [Sphingomonas sp.]|uniref:ExeA family protein n=1 Tax=Sphingomonas sp. TaxID=28214 RepID=UPI0025EA57F7|nr:AAA family ATPase [Sphingomonas sp.]MBY0283007.1 AAA family ATPase [Sphingomonas sp.]